MTSTWRPVRFTVILAMVRSLPCLSASRPRFGGVGSLRCCFSHSTTTSSPATLMGCEMRVTLVLAGAMAVGVLLTTSSSTNADAIQWTVENGGSGHWYEPVKASSQVSWTDAKTLAEQRGGYLACVTSQSENDFVFSLVSDFYWWTDGAGTPMFSGGPWIGGYQDRSASDYSEPAGGWRWVSGEAWAYTNWNIGEPNNGWFPGEDTLQYIWTNGSLTSSPYWNDRYDACPEPPWSYVVEYNTQPAPEPSTLVLFGIGAISLFAWRRRRRAA